MVQLHDYRKGKLLNTALYEVVDTIKKALSFKKYMLASLLNIEGSVTM